MLDECYRPTNILFLLGWRLFFKMVAIFLKTTGTLEYDIIFSPVKCKMINVVEIRAIYY